MQDMDQKPAVAKEEDGIEVAEVNEILDDGAFFDLGPNAVSQVVDGNGIQQEEEQQQQTDHMKSKSEILSIFKQFGVVPFVAKPIVGRKYAKRKSFRRLMKKYVRTKLRPLKPTATCKRYMHIRLPYRNPVVSFFDYRKKYLQRPRGPKKPKPVEPDYSLVPLTLEDYVKEIDPLIETVFHYGATVPAPAPELNIKSIQSYKSTLLSRINSKIIETVVETKPDSGEFEAQILVSDSGEVSLILDASSWNQAFPLRTGMRVCVEVADEKLIGNIVGTLRYEVSQEEDKAVKYELTLDIKDQNQKLPNETKGKVRPVGLIGHLILAAKAVIQMEILPLHVQFLKPVIKSYASGISIEFSESFRKRYERDIFYVDSIQKIIDTVALTVQKDEASNICVVEDVSDTNLSNLFIDAVTYLLRKEKNITDLWADPSDWDDISERSLHMVIVSDSDKTLEKIENVLEDNRFAFYSPQKRFSPSARSLLSANILIEQLEKQIGSCKNAIRLEAMKKSLKALKEAKYRSREYESGKRAACDSFLITCPILIGSLSDLLNDEHVCYMIAKKLRKFDVALIHNAAAVHDSELLSLLLLDVSKLICFAVTAASSETQTISHRMLGLASKMEWDPNSPVLDRSEYMDRHKKKRDEEREKRRQASQHQHSYRDVRFNENSQDCFRRQAEGTHHRPPPPPIHPSRGRGWGNDTRGRGLESRGRGFDSRGRGSDARGRGSESRGRGFESRGRGFDSRGRGSNERGRGRPFLAGRGAPINHKT